MDGNTVVALVVGRAELDKDTVHGMGWMRTWLRCWRGERSWIEIRCMVLLDGKEVDGLGG